MATLTGAVDVETAVEKIVACLVRDEAGLGEEQGKFYFDGWCGLGASAVLRSIAEHPPPSLFEKFDKIVHIDCSSWTSRRALQRAIADALKLTQLVAADFDKQDEEDDFSGVHQSSRAEIERVARVIVLSLVQYSCLVIFHNGSDGMVDLRSCGIPQVDLIGTKVLWTFRGRLRLFKRKEWPLILADRGSVHALLEEEAREIALYTHKLGLGVTPEIARECCLYLLSLHYRGGRVIDYNWATHASNYWVCDGIVEGSQDNRAWELAHALQQQIRLEDYSSNVLASFFDISTKHWIFIDNFTLEEVPPGTTSLFFAPRVRSGYVSFPNNRFYEADQLRVLKLCRCTFSFSSPPFYCCRNLRFLGLDRCMDEPQREEEKHTGAQAVETFQRLWVLDVCHTDWELDFPLETEEPVVATEIREVHINKGRIWRKNLAWRRLPNLCKLRVVEPTTSWEMGREAFEFKDMVKLELLDLSRNSTILVLPSLLGAANLKTLVLHGCVGLEHVGPQGLPPSLESFCFDAGGIDSSEDHENKAKIYRISLAGCKRLADFRLHGSLPNLEELDLSRTAVKMLDLKKVVQVGNLQRIMLVGCKQLRSVSWPETFKLGYGWKTGMHKLRLLCIDMQAGGEVARRPSCGSLMACQGEEEAYCHAFITSPEMRFLQSLEFLTETTKLKLNLCFSSTTSEDNGRSCYKKKTAGPLAAGSPLPNKSLVYHDVITEQQINTQIPDGRSNENATTQFQQLDVHAEIGAGVSDVPNTVSAQGRSGIVWLMNRVESLHVHDSSSITTVAPGHIFMSPGVGNRMVMHQLKWCIVERCPMLDTVFDINYDHVNFPELETFWAGHLLMAHSIWSRPRRPWYQKYNISFTALRAIHLHFCPRLRYVLVLSSNFRLSNQLETLHIFYCGDLRQVFPVEQEYVHKIATSHLTKGMLAFPKLKHLYLHELPSLQLICEAKMFAPNLETIRLRGCWSLRRLPATDGKPVAVSCEKECWDKLEWDRMGSGHHPSLFQPRHSKYYKKRHLRSTVLR